MKQTARTLTSPRELADAGLIAPGDVSAMDTVASRYAVAVTPHLAALIGANGASDPIARQFIPSTDELVTTSDELTDPIGDARHSPVKGIVHRYRDRVLLKLTHLCPVYCRFCFRREMVGPGEDQMLNPADLDGAIAYIAAHKEIWEVILTGGDPWTLSDRRIADVTARLSAIDHVKILRWHTRVPVADPARVNDALIHALKSSKPVFAAIHVNRARELTEETCHAVSRLREAGIPLLSQSVLLRGVNDDIATLETLMRALIEAQITPYYLHHPDLAPGTGHFRVSIARGRELVRELRARSSGLCQPHYVLDIPGGYSKALLSESDVQETDEFDLLRDAHGMLHRRKK